MTTPQESDRLTRERGHFDALVVETGESWWGHGTRAGKRRLRRRARIVAGMLPDRRPLKVLEVGCGTGPWTAELLKCLDDVHLIASDLSPLSLQAAQDKCRGFPNVQFDLQDLMAMSYCDETFDAVVGNSILHHVPPEPALAEIFRVLRRGGMAVFFEPNSMNPQHAIDFGFERRRRARKLQFTDQEHPFHRRSLRRVVAGTGFARAAVEPIDFLHPLVPGPLVSLVELVGRVVERVPLVREVSGSLLVSGMKPAGQTCPVHDDRPADTLGRGVSVAT